MKKELAARVASKARHTHLSFIALTGFGLAMVAGLAGAFSGPGTQWHWWNFRTGFVILRWSAYAGAVAAAISFLGCILTRPGASRRGLTLSCIGFLVGGMVFGVPFWWSRMARQVPPIHDITTDTEDPPRFVAILPLRKNAPNSAEYGGPELAAKQRAAYPDLSPALLSLPPEKGFNLALLTAQKMGWEIVHTSSSGLRIEATDTTFWFGFKDDIVIRIRKTDQGCRIDVRSVSRVGRSDVGTNARRIRRYLKYLKEMNE